MSIKTGVKARVLAILFTMYLAVCGVFMQSSHVHASTLFDSPTMAMASTEPQDFGAFTYGVTTSTADHAATARAVDHGEKEYKDAAIRESETGDYQLRPVEGQEIIVSEPSSFDYFAHMDPSSLMLNVVAVVMALTGFAYIIFDFVFFKNLRIPRSAPPDEQN